MFMRILQIKINPAFAEPFRNFFQYTVIPEIKQLEGALFIGLIKSSTHKDEFISFSFWNSSDNAEQCEKKGIFAKLMKKFRPYLAESTEWKIQLSENLELEYKPVTKEPILKEYSVLINKDENKQIENYSSRMYVRIVSPKIQKEKLEEFKKIYSEKIIPALSKTPGCQYAFLIGNISEDNDVLSVTIWDSREDAEKYEKNGQFDDLVHLVEHTFSSFYQWKMALEKDFRGDIKTSEDIQVSHYSVVSGKKFK
ncbi:MAG: antibiotic biosynthesis monooxygenase [Calditrichaceae bacterium]